MIESRKEKEISLKKKISIITILSDECKMKNRLRKIMTIIGMTLMLATVVGVNSMSAEIFGEMMEDANEF